MFDRVGRDLERGFSTWRAMSLSPLRQATFRMLWLATLTANFGAIIQLTGASWSMTELGASPGLVALVQTFSALPVVILALPAGALVDTADRRAIMVGAQTLSFLAALSLAGLAFAGSVTPLVLLAVATATGVATALYQPAWQASFADITTRDALPAAVGLNAVSFNIARSIGPALAGFIIAAGGTPVAFLGSALASMVALGILISWRPTRASVPLPPEPFGAAIVLGLRYVAMSPTLRAILVRAALCAFGFGVTIALVPLIAREQLNSSAIGFGLLLGGFGLGALIAATTLALLRQRLGNGRLVTLATAVYAVATLGVGFSSWTPLSILFMALNGACTIYATVTLHACVQLFSPRWVVGRTIALGFMATWGGVAAGSACWGLVAQEIGLSAAFAAAAAFLFATLIAARFATIPAHEEHDLNQVGREIAPTSLHVEAETGPVVIILEYRVPPASAAAFLDAAHQLGRTRRRDGAAHWSISQDLDNSELWLERIESATWNDFLRRVSRGTAADQATRERVLALCIVPPVVRRMVERPPGAQHLI